MAFAVTTDTTEQPTTPAVAADTAATATEAGVVPQAQIDRVKKRAEMDKRRAELLKVRQQLIQADSPGNLDGQQPIQ